MRNNFLILAALAIVGAGAAVWLVWSGSGLGSPEAIQQRLVGEWYLYEQGDFGPMNATEHLEVYTFHDTTDRVKSADGSDDLIRDLTLTAYLDNVPSFMSTATTVSRFSRVDLQQIHTIGTIYEVFDNQVAINMGNRGVRILTIRELDSDLLVWTENDATSVLVRKNIYETAPVEELARKFGVEILSEGPSD